MVGADQSSESEEAYLKAVPKAPHTPLTPEEKTRLAELPTRIRALEERLADRIVGQERVIRELLIAFFSGGHVLLVGVPGLAKTLMIRSIADLLSLDFARIQFTPDLMPSDITGTSIIVKNETTGDRSFQFR